MKRSKFFKIVGICGAVLVGSSSASADQTYHSERLDFKLTVAGATAGHPALRSGQVVNIHPNGAVNGALERYMINGAKPSTSYQVEILIFAPGDSQCSGDLAFFVPTAILNTNKLGSAHGQGHFSRADLVPFKGAVLPVKWALLDNNKVEAYASRCTIVSID